MKFCFAAPHAYGLFDPATRAVFGGAEVRAYTLGKALARHPDMEVTFVVMHDKDVQCERFGRITVWRDPSGTPTPRPSMRQRAFSRVRARLASPRIAAQRMPSGRACTFELVGADVYGVFGASDYAADLASYCRASGRRSVLFLSSGGDLTEEYRRDSLARNVYGSRHDRCYQALMSTDLVLAQTDEQRERLRARFGRDSVVIPNPIELPSATMAADRSARKHVLWIGKADRVKGAEELVRLAKALPDLRFLMVLNRSDPEIFRRVQQERPANVEIREFVPYDGVDTLFDEALALVSTSIFEGFPNTFLQAGKFGVPVVSLNVDPDGFLAQHGCGIHAAGDFERLVRGLRTIGDDDSTWHRYSQCISGRVRAHHDLDTVADQLKRALMGLH